MLSKILLVCLLVCACTRPTMGDSKADGQTSETASTSAHDAEACRVHTSMVSPASLKKQLPADEAALKVRASREMATNWRQRDLLRSAQPCAYQVNADGVAFTWQTVERARSTIKDILDGKDEVLSSLR